MTTISSTEPHAGEPTALSPYRHYPALPSPLTEIVGRCALLERIRAVLDAGDTRLVTLTGPGGIGKTRLALETPTVLHGEFAHGAHFVELAPVQDQRLVPAAVAGALRIKVVGETPVPDAIATTLRDQHALLVLDNLEHVIDGAAPWLAGLLARCPRLHVLATSRRALHIGGERQVQVPPLDLPATAAELEAIGQSDAVRLFVERGRAARSDFTLTADNAEAVAAICRSLDGVPLALELAAARINVLSPPALLARLTNRLSVLAGNRRDVPSRHQTMRDAIDWSYWLLREPEQRLLRLISVFSGGFTLAAVEGVAERWAPDISVLDAFDTLTDHSLVRRHPGARGGDRFSVLEVVREFGQDRLAEMGEAEAARDAHAAFFTRLAADTEEDVYERSQVASLDALEAEHDNIWVALDWLLLRERYEDASELAGSIWYLRRVRVYTAEARARLDTLLAHPRVQGRTIRRARALLLLGTYASELGDPPGARAALEEAMSIFREHGDDLGMARALRRMAVTLTNTGDIVRAIEALKERLDLTTRHGHQWEVATSLDYLAGLFLYQNDHAATQACLTEGLRLYRAIGDRFGIASVLSTQGMLSAREGDARRARQCYQECLELSTEFDYDYHLPIALLGLGDVTLREGDIAAADACLTDALAEARETGWLHGVAVARAGLGAVEMRRGNLGLAIRREQESLADFNRIGLRFGLQHGATLCFDTLACVALATGETVTAARFLGMADGLHGRIGVARPLGEPHYVGQREIGEIRKQLNDPEIREAWSEGHAMSDDDVLAAALDYRLPDGFAFAALAPELPEAVKALTPRELDVLRLIAAGRSNQEIADALFLSTRTVAGHVANLLKKLAVTSRTGAAAFAIRNGIA